MYNIDRNTLVSLLKFDISLYIFSETITFTYIYNIDLKLGWDDSPVYIALSFI